MSVAAIDSVEFISSAQVCKRGKIRIKHSHQDRYLFIFLGCMACVSLLSFVPLGINWVKLITCLPDLYDFFFKLFHLTLLGFNYTLVAFLETISITILATIYGILVGIVFSALAARNLVRNPWITGGLSAYFTFLRAVPTPVWVLLA